MIKFLKSAEMRQVADGDYPYPLRIRTNCQGVIVIIDVAEVMKCHDIKEAAQDDTN